MKKYNKTRLLKRKNQHRGYALLFLMLILGSLGLYLSYKMSLTKMNTQSWQLDKTATEFSYWFDVEQNYQQDYAITNPTDLNNIQLSTLIQNHYLPYGTARTPTFASSGTPAVTAISEFQCSPLPGITQADGTLSDSGITDNTCPIQTPTALVQCTLNQPAYYSCLTNAAVSQAQYYLNANHIALSGGTLRGTSTSSSSAPIALGLIVRTPGFSNSLVDLGASGRKGLLPNGSYAQSLITTLPSSSFNLYSTDSPEVNGIGIGSYLSIDNTKKDPNTIFANDRYSKIIDMGLIQSVNLNTASSAKPCYGWDANGNKTGTNTSYTGSGSLTNGGTFPPTCIRINMLKYGPGGSEKCARLDLFYTVYRNYLQNDAKTSSWNGYQYGGYDSTSARLFSSTDSVVTTSSVSNYLDVYLGQTIQSATNYSSYSYSVSKVPPTSDSLPEEYNWLAYFIRCTRANT